MAREFWGRAVNKAGRTVGRELGPFPTREEANAAAWAAHPNARAVSTGHGNGAAYFDLQATRRPPA